MTADISKISENVLQKMSQKDEGKWHFRVCWHLNIIIFVNFLWSNVNQLNCHGKILKKKNLRCFRCSELFTCNWHDQYDEANIGKNCNFKPYRNYYPVIFFRIKTESIFQIKLFVCLFNYTFRHAVAYHCFLFVCFLFLIIICDMVTNFFFFFFVCFW